MLSLRSAAIRFQAAALVSRYTEPVTRARLEADLQRFFEGHRDDVISAYLFGSHARDRSHRESDIDIGVLLNRASAPTPAIRFERRLRLTGDLMAVSRRPAVDVVILNDAPPQFARSVLVNGRRVFCADDEADHAFLRTTLLRAADLEPFLRRTRRVKLAALAR